MPKLEADAVRVSAMKDPILEAVAVKTWTPCREVAQWRKTSWSLLPWAALPVEAAAVEVATVEAPSPLPSNRYRLPWRRDVCFRVGMEVAALESFFCGGCCEGMMSASVYRDGGCSLGKLLLRRLLWRHDVCFRV
jgi:hypothetical protein